MSDEDALARIEQETASQEVSPSVFPPRLLFKNARPEDVLVAVLDDRVAGFLVLRPPTPFASNTHVLMISGLAVDPSAQRKGVASALLKAGHRRHALGSDRDPRARRDRPRDPARDRATRAVAEPARDGRRSFPLLRH